MRGTVEHEGVECPSVGQGRGERAKGGALGVGHGVAAEGGERSIDLHDRIRRRVEQYARLRRGPARSRDRGGNDGESALRAARGLHLSPEADGIKRDLDAFDEPLLVEVEQKRSLLDNLAVKAEAEQVLRLWRR